MRIGSIRYNIYERIYCNKIDKRTQVNGRLYCDNCFIEIKAEAFTCKRSYACEQNGRMKPLSSQVGAIYENPHHTLI